MITSSNKNLISIAPPSIDWWITSHCNLSCPFCYGPSPDIFEKKEDRFIILEAINFSKSEYVTLCGGEPLIVKNINTIVESLVNNGNKKVIINTNGQLLASQKNLDKNLLQGIHAIGISLDGYDMLSHSLMRGNNANFSESLNAIRSIRDRYTLSLKIATVVSAVNLDYIMRIGDLVDTLKPNVWRIYQYTSRGQGKDNKKKYEISESVFNAKVTELKFNYPQLNIKDSNSLDLEGCFIIDYKGDILQPFGDDYLTVGSCLDRNIDELWLKHWARPEIVLNNKRWLTNK